MWCRGEEFREEGGGLFCHLLYFQRKGGLDLPYLPAGNPIFSQSKT